MEFPFGSPGNVCSLLYFFFQVGNWQLDQEYTGKAWGFNRKLSGDQNDVKEVECHYNLVHTLHQHCSVRATVDQVDGR